MSGKALSAMVVLGAMAVVVYRRQQATEPTVRPVAYKVTTTRKKGFDSGLGDGLATILGGAIDSLSTAGKNNNKGGIFGGLFGRKGTPTATPAVGKVVEPIAKPKVAPAVRGAGSGSVAPLLALIRRYEAGSKGYDAYYTGVSKPPPRRLTTMTVREVLAWQDRIDPYSPSEAAGAYQIMEDTLRPMVASGVVASGALYNKSTQDKLAMHLLRRRGLTKYQNGTLSAEAFANNIAKEWASFPVVTGSKKGRSYYAGDGLNKAHVSVSQSLNAVRAI